MIDYLYIVMIAMPIGLVAFSVAFWGGIYKCLCVSEILIMSIAFMLFQTGMLFLGSWTGNSFAGSIGWLSIPIAEALILVTGVKLIYSGVRLKPEQKSFDLSKYWELIAVSFASSLNAFMIGLGMGLLRDLSDRTFAITVVATAILAISGAYMGKRIGKMMIIRVSGIISGILVIALGLLTALDLYNVI